MRNKYTEALKKYLSQALKEERKNSNMTQLEMAGRLEMDVRSYVELEHGNSVFSGVTLTLFLLRTGVDSGKVLKEIEKIYKEEDAKKKGEKK